MLLAGVATGQGSLLDNAGILWLAWVVALAVVLLVRPPDDTKKVGAFPAHLSQPTPGNS